MSAPSPWGVPEGKREGWERTFREGGVDGVVQGLALFRGALLLLQNVLRGGLLSPYRNWFSIPIRGAPEGEGAGWERTFREG